MTTSESGPILVFLVELWCLQCGRDVGTLEARHWPYYGPALLRRSGARQALRVADWSRLRCAACQGYVYAGVLRDD
jgi:hypothetical protein